VKKKKRRNENMLSKDKKVLNESEKEVDSKSDSPELKQLETKLSKWTKIKAKFEESLELNQIGEKLKGILFSTAGLNLKFLLIDGIVRYMGKVTKASPLLKFLTGYDAIILINKYEWEHLSPIQKEALVFHELCHIVLSDDGIKLRKHDVEEFVAVASRYGAWIDNLEEMKEALQDKNTKIKLEETSQDDVGSVQ